MLRCILAVLFVVMLGLGLKAQTPDTVDHRNKKDSLNLKRDSATSKPFKPKIKPEKVYHPDSNHSPHTALIRSAMFPGLGQIYNRRLLWIRLPIIYGGLVLLVDAIIFNQKYYSSFLQESQYRERGRIDTAYKDPYPNATDASIYAVKDAYRRDRDLSILGIFGAWGINMIDAYVEAKFLHSYTMDNNLSFKITPSVMSPPVFASNFNPTFAPALKITFTFR